MLSRCACCARCAQGYDIYEHAANIPGRHAEPQPIIFAYIALNLQTLAQSGAWKTFFGAEQGRGRVVGCLVRGRWAGGQQVAGAACAGPVKAEGVLCGREGAAAPLALGACGAPAGRRRGAGGPGTAGTHAPASPSLHPWTRHLTHPLGIPASNPHPAGLIQAPDEGALRGSGSQGSGSQGGGASGQQGSADSGGAAGSDPAAARAAAMSEAEKAVRASWFDWRVGAGWREGVMCVWVGQGGIGGPPE